MTQIYNYVPKHAQPTGGKIPAGGRVAPIEFFGYQWPGENEQPNFCIVGVFGVNQQTGEPLNVLVMNVQEVQQNFHVPSDRMRAQIVKAYMADRKGRLPPELPDDAAMPAGIGEIP